MKNLLLFLLALLPLILIPKCLVACSYLPDDIYFFTNRDQTVEDTLYLPIEKECFIKLGISRFVKKHQFIDDPTDYLQTVHWIDSKTMLGECDQRTIKSFSWMPTQYKRIVPTYAIIYEIDSITPIPFHTTKGKDIDFMCLHTDSLTEIHYWEADSASSIGEAIVYYMPLVEMFITEKISNEVTLTKNTFKYIVDEMFIHILPQKTADIQVKHIEDGNSQ